MYLERLREIREENNHKQREVASKLKVSLGTYAMNELGYDTITLKNLILFSDIYNVSIDFLFGFTKIRQYDNNKKYFDRETLRNRLKECRRENGYTQEMIGDLLLIDHSVWCRYEKGKTLILTSFLYTICLKLGISADYLLGRIDSPKYIKVLVNS